MRSVFLLLLLLTLILPTGCNHAPSGDKEVKQNLKGNLKDSVDKMLKEAKLQYPVDQEQALRDARRALAFAYRSGNPDLIAHACISLGVYHTNSQNDSAYFYFNTALQTARLKKTDKPLALIFYNLGLLYGSVSNYPSAIAMLDSSIWYATKNQQFKVQSDAYNQLGGIYYDSKNKALSLKMYETSYALARLHSYYLEMGVVLSNIAKFDNDIRSNLQKLHTALKFVQMQPGNTEEAATICTNIAFRHTDPDSVIFYSNMALNFCGSNKATETGIGAYNNMVYGYLDKGMTDQAARCLTDYAIPLAISRNSDDWLATLYDTYADVLGAKGQFRLALEYEKKAIGSREKADAKAAYKQVRLLSTMMDVKSKEELIRKNTEELNAKRASMRILSLFLVMLILVVIGTVLGYSRVMLRKKLNQQKLLSESARRIISLEENEKARVSMELHDLIGPMIMSIKRQMEEMEIPDPAIREELSSKLLTLAGRLRSLSHRMNLVLQQNHSFSELIVGLCNDMKGLSELHIHLTMPSGDPELTREQIGQIYRIIQELLTNAIKYVKVGTVALSVNVEQGRLFILYEDKGPGFDKTSGAGKSMGVMNIFERAGFLGGAAHLNTNPGNGTRWTINVPLSNS